MNYELSMMNYELGKIMCKYANVQMCKYANVQMCKCANGLMG
jgi:hypothetical protein